MVNNYQICSPNPAATIESLTGVGYTLKTAIADLIDNSITAQARNIWIDFFWAGKDSYISVLDDGHGMNESELFEAMRPGGKNPNDERHGSDLGRFSLGLKTASWSQARKVSVFSKSAESAEAKLCWDLNYVCKHNEWRVTTPSDLPINLSNFKKLNAGTLVLWETLTAPLYQELVDSKDGLKEFNHHIDLVQKYLGMVFYRFILGQAKSNRNTGPINIYVNGNLTEAWDPFQVSSSVYSKVTPLETIKFMGIPLDIKGYVLPHKDKLTEAEYLRGGGPSGWLDQQGFYIFRGERLLVAGSWLGLGKPRPWLKEEQYRLARISIEIPNSLDRHWSLDIKKSTAVPPPQIKQKLTNLAEQVRESAKEAFIFRGKYGTRPTNSTYVESTVWNQSNKKNGLSYKVNRDHPLIKGLSDKLGPLEKEFSSVIRVIEESVPVQKIWIDSAESDQGHAIPYEGMTKELKEDVVATYKYLLRTMSGADALIQLKLTEPFNRYIQDIDEIIGKL
jgi:Histidine kinase-, DNA gyrase B-, and HSP90-like ATPase